MHAATSTATGNTLLPPPPPTMQAPALRGRHLLTDTDLSPGEIQTILTTAAQLKAMHHAGQPHPYLAGKTLGMLFEHPSTRTRISFQAGIAQLGGVAIMLDPGTMQLSRGETMDDTAAVVSRYVDGVVARVARHESLQQWAAAASVPLFNGLSDRCHPMQALADMLTLQETFGSLAGLTLAYLGDGNNVCTSLMLIGAALGLHVRVGCPPDFAPPSAVTDDAIALGQASGGSVTVTADPAIAVDGAQAVYTDVQISMGQPDEAARRHALAPYQVTAGRMASAAPDAIFMHCLPMHRGDEVTAEVANGPQSVIFDQAENRLHVQKAVMVQTMA